MSSLTKHDLAYEGLKEDLDVDAFCDRHAEGVPKDKSRFVDKSAGKETPKVVVLARFKFLSIEVELPKMLDDFRSFFKDAGDSKTCIVCGPHDTPCLYALLYRL